MLVLVICALVALAVMNRRLAGSFLYPPALFSAVWAVYLALYAGSGDLFFKISEDTLFFYAWGPFVMSVGGFAWLTASRLRTSRYSAPQLSDRRKLLIQRVLDILLLIAAVGLPFYIRYVMSLVENAGLLGLWVTLRAKMVEQGSQAVETVSAIDNLVVLANALPLLVYLQDDGTFGKRCRTIISLLLACSYNLLTASRAGFAALILSFLALNWIKHGKPNWKVLVALGVSFAIMFAALAILVQKGDVEKDASVAENLPAVYDGFLWYAIGGMVAFDTIYHHPTAIEATQNIDRDLQVVLRKFDSHVEIPDIHAEYTTIGPTGNMNIYTMYYSYYPEFGFWGTTIILFFLGSVLTWIYLYAISGYPLGMVAYSILFCGIVMSEYSENFLLNLNFLFKMLFFIYLLFYWGSRPPEAEGEAALSPVPVSG